jgi:hypothetical protein
MYSVDIHNRYLDPGDNLVNSGDIHYRYLDPGDNLVNSGDIHCIFLNTGDIHCIFLNTVLDIIWRILEIFIAYF